MKKIKKSKKSRIHAFQFDIKGIDDKLRTDCWEWVWQKNSQLDESKQF